jgi:hypothetical protein
VQVGKGVDALREQWSEGVRAVNEQAQQAVLATEDLRVKLGQDWIPKVQVRRSDQQTKSGSQRQGGIPRSR